MIPRGVLAERDALLKRLERARTDRDISADRLEALRAEATDIIRRGEAAGVSPRDGRTRSATVVGVWATFLAENPDVSLSNIYFGVQPIGEVRVEERFVKEVPLGDGRTVTVTQHARAAYALLDIPREEWSRWEATPLNTGVSPHLIWTYRRAAERENVALTPEDFGALHIALRDHGLLNGADASERYAGTTEWSGRVSPGKFETEIMHAGAINRALADRGVEPISVAEAHAWRFDGWNTEDSVVAVANLIEAGIDLAAVRNFERHGVTRSSQMIAAHRDGLPLAWAEAASAMEQARADDAREAAAAAERARRTAREEERQRRAERLEHGV